MPRQSDLRFSFSVSAGGGGNLDLSVISFRLQESLSEPFMLTLELSSPQPDIDFGSVLEQDATFVIWRGEQAERYVHGVVSEFCQKDSGFRRTHYAVTVEPLLSRADLRSDWRVYQNATIPGIVAQALARSGVQDIDAYYTREHLPTTYCVQPGETDLHFIKRLCAEHGIYFAFRFDARGSTLSLGDRLYTHGVIEGGPVLYNATPGGDQAQPCLSKFQYTERVRTARQVQSNYDHHNPRYNHRLTRVGDKLDHQAGDYQQFNYPGRYVDDAIGKPKTEARLLALRRDAKVASIRGDDARLIPGLAFDMEGHGREDWNVGWRVLNLVHEGTQTTSQENESATATVGTHYEYTGEVIPDRVEWRAPQLPKPRIDGPQVAIVVGPKGEEIFTNGLGEVLVQFAWDHYGNNDEHSSCWVRAGQAAAGPGYGIQSIPRIGQEVLVAFESGDADTPVIISRLHNSPTPPPYELPRHKTRTVIRTQTHKGQGNNELHFEDEAGMENVYLRAQRDQTSDVLNNQVTRIGNDRTESIQHDQRVAIGNEYHLEVTGDSVCELKAEQRIRVQGDRRTELAADDRLSIGGTLTIHAGDSQLLGAGREIHLQAGDKLICDGGLQLSLAGGGHFIKLDPSGIHSSVPIQVGGAPGLGTPILDAALDPDHYVLAALAGPLLISQHCEFASDGRCKIHLRH
ncbi:type VI secretion system tip protein TssI/VgrG [Dyella kyungheensis]|uniref:Type VI secretion system tip protein VgrG n=1 Tax=Dyella kyungheensis TaxID=1242174 RepID=A0ABS2JSM6_9GAMM|nr:type VI secretion system tip protein VgrG [Dyella kyungheensis]